MNLFLSVIAMSSCLATIGNGAKVLLAPIPTGSHVMNFQQLGEALVEAGHEVHVVTDYKCKSTSKFKKSGLVIQSYDTGSCAIDSPEVLERRSQVMTMEKSVSKMLSMFAEINSIAKEYTKTIYSNDTLFSELKAQSYDMCIVDGVYFFRFMYILPYKLDIPVVSFLASFNPIDASVPALPSFTPFIDEGKYTDEMNFLERFTNTLETFYTRYVVKLFVPSLRNSIVSEYAPEKPYKPLDDIVSSSKLWLIQSDIALDYPQVRLPHVIDIGGTNIRPAKPLPKTFQELLDGAVEGAVVVSFGSMVASFPPEISVKLLNEFHRLKQTVIWRHDGKNIGDIPSNVHLFNWLPQNDLLAHTNTKVFVTHCGANGQFEALYNAVPMVGLPLFADQIYNSKRMAKKGLGFHLELFKFIPGELYTAIQAITNNSTFQDAMTRHSQIFHDRPMNPKETLVYWVEHVIKYGAKHLRSHGIELPWYKYWCFDVLIVFLLIIFITLFLLYKVMVLVVRVILRLTGNGGKDAKRKKKKE